MTATLETSHPRRIHETPQERLPDHAVLFEPINVPSQKEQPQEEVAERAAELQDRIKDALQPIHHPGRDTFVGTDKGGNDWEVLRVDLYADNGRDVVGQWTKITYKDKAGFATIAEVTSGIPGQSSITLRDGSITPGGAHPMVEYKANTLQTMEMTEKLVDVLEGAQITPPLRTRPVRRMGPSLKRKLF